MLKPLLAFEGEINRGPNNNFDHIDPPETHDGTFEGGPGNDSDSDYQELDFDPDDYPDHHENNEDTDEHGDEP